jgi:hypothetical protein
MYSILSLKLGVTPSAAQAQNVGGPFFPLCFPTIVFYSLQLGSYPSWTPQSDKRPGASLQLSRRLLMVIEASNIPIIQRQYGLARKCLAAQS